MSPNLATIKKASRLRWWSARLLAKISPESGSGIANISAPVCLVVMMTIMVFVTETFVMMFLHHALPRISAILEGVVDHIILIVLLTSSLYFLLLKPIAVHNVITRCSLRQFRT